MSLLPSVVSKTGYVPLRTRFDFLSSLPSIYTFDRDQTAPYTDSNGDAQTAGNDVPRFDHDADGNPLGILLEDLATDDDTLSIEDLDSAGYSWFAEGRGYIIVRAKIDSDTSNNHYLVAISAGSTTNIIAIRSDVTDILRAQIRTSSVNQHTSNTGVVHPLGVYTCFCITWDADAGVGAIYDVFAEDVRTSLTLPTGLTTINVGARNAGADDLNGHIALLAVGKEYLSATQARAKFYEAGDIVVAMAGQSLMTHLFTAPTGGANGGQRAIVETGAGLLSPPNTVHCINGAVSGSSVLYSSNNSDYWYDNRDGTAGNHLTALIAAAAAQGQTPNVLGWKQASGDYGQISAGTSTIEDYRAGLDFIFNHARAIWGNRALPIILSPVGGRASAVSDGADAAAQAIREEQWDLITADANIHKGPESFDIPFVDDVHHTDAGYITLGQRWARIIAKINGETVSGSTTGMEMVSATYSGATIDITIAHDGGTDFTPTSGIEGFTVFDGASKATISSAVRVDATTIRITLSGTPSNAPVVYYIYGVAGGITQSNIVTDNSAQALPLRAGKVTATAS